MISHKNYNLKKIVSLLNESEHVYWILDLEGGVHSIWDLWISGFQECKGNGFSKLGRRANNFRSGLENLNFLDGWLPCLNLPPLKSSGKGGESLTSSIDQFAITPHHSASVNIKLKDLWALVDQIKFNVPKLNITMLWYIIALVIGENFGHNRLRS